MFMNEIILQSIWSLSQKENKGLLGNDCLYETSVPTKLEKTIDFILSIQDGDMEREAFCRQPTKNTLIQLA
uniref:Uncharacterized protein n=1 Tax=Strigamia maritima TaxID=126957 RepID=T1JME7_STRMM